MKVEQQPMKRVSTKRPSGTLLFAAWLLVGLFAPSAAMAANPAAAAPVQSMPRLSSLEIEIWPDYDRRAALVMVKAELPADAPLPADLTLRIPGSSGGPSAVAFADVRQSGLFNLQHERTVGDGFIVLRLRTPQRYVHVEFYDPIATNELRHKYKYVWPGDLAAERLSIRLQEPAGASAIAVEPDLGAGVDGPDGLLYRTRTLGAWKAGVPLPIEVSYTKKDSRTSTEILGLKAQAPAPAQRDAAPTVELPPWLYGLVSLSLVGIVAVGLSLWWYRRRSPAAAAGGRGERFWTACGAAMARGDRYCARCGAGART